MKIKLVASLILALALLVPASPVYAIPALPHAFYGDVEINGASAPDGSSVSAVVSNGTIVAVQNPVTTVGGSYGVDSPKLLVQGDIDDGATITFYVNGVSAGQTAEWHSGETTELDLSVGIAAAPPPTPTVETTLFGIEGSFPISDEGEILETIVATSEDGNLTITIEAGTIALLEGEPLETLTAAVEPSPPEPPEGAYLIGAYDFGPDGATFAPPITLTWSYDPEAVPEGMDLVIAYYDEVNEEWVWIPCEVDTENNIITASVAHFTTFAIITVPVVAPLEEEEVPPVEEEEEEVITPPVGEEEEEEEEIIPPVGEEEEEEEEEVTPAPSRINWPLIGGIIGGVVVVGLLIFFVLRRRAY